MDSVSPFMKLVATRLKPLGPTETMKCAVEAGTILARDLNPDEQEIIGNAFLVIGHILTKISQYHHDDSENKWQQAREAQIELSEIEMEIQKLQQRIDKLVPANSSSEG